MALSLGSLAFNGTHGEIKEGDWQLDVKRTKFMGTIGVSELLGGVGSRTIETKIWLHNLYATGAAVANALHQLDRQIGLHGRLVETGAISRYWDNVTFDGFTREKGPLPPSGNVQGWFIVGTLRFTQLKPNGT